MANLTPVLLIPAAILTTPAENFATSFASVVDTSVVDTGGKFATRVVDTGGANDLQISPQIFEKM